MRVSSVHDQAAPRRSRSWLALGTALGSLMAAPAIAQSLPPPQLPTAGSVRQSDPDGLLTAPVVTSGNGRLDVALRSRNTVIDWNGFNIPENNRANFSDGRLIGGDAMAVLNRDVSGNVSQLLGRLTSDSNVAVWVFNPNGILVGGRASFNTGSLVLTTLAPDAAEFRAGGRSFTLAAPAGSQAGPITVLNGAQIRVEGGNRGLVMVAPKIDAAGTFEAIGQDVAFVTATDVTLNYANNGPLSVTLTRGTPVAGRSQYVRGTVEGNDALFALASQGTITDSLLQVDASVTTALAGTRGIVLSAGTPATPVAGVTVAAVPAETGGTAGLLVGGTLTSTDNDGSDIIAGANNTASFTGALNSRRDVLLGAGGALSVSGAIDAERLYSASGTGITLGGTAPVTQSAGSITATSTNGDIVGNAGLLLQTNAGGGIALATTGSTAGDIRFAPTTRIAAGADRGGVLTLQLRDAANVVTLGDVAARGLRGAAGAAAPANGLALSSALTIGNVDVRNPLVLGASGITAGTLASDGAVDLTSTGALSAQAITARGGSVTLGGTGTTTVTGAIRGGGTNADVSVIRDGAIVLNGITAGRTITLGGAVPAASVVVAGDVTAGRDYVVNAGAVQLGGGPQVSQSANGAVTITAGTGGITGVAGLTLGSNADGIGTEALTLAIDPAATGGAIAFAPGTKLSGGTARQSDVQIRSADASGPVSIDRVVARSLRGAVAADAFAEGITRSSALRVGDVSLVGSLRLNGAGVQTGAISSGNAVAIEGNAGAVTIGGDVVAGGALTLRGGAVTLSGTQASSGGAIDIRAASGGISSTQALALTSSSTRAQDFVRVQAAGAEGIDFAAGSTITAGADQALRVAVFNATAGAPLALGNVTARSLGALAALDGDATAPAGAIVQAGALNFGTLRLVDSFAAQSTAGDLTVGSIAVSGAGQGIRLEAAGALETRNIVSASGDVTLASGAALTLNTVESRDGRASVTSNGRIRLAALNGAQAAVAQGASLSIDAVRGGRVSLTATQGDAALGIVSGSTVTADALGGALSITSLTAAQGGRLSADGAVTATGALVANGGDLSISAGRAASVTGGAQASGAVSITGRTVTLDGTHQAGGAYTVQATQGDVTGGWRLAITSDTDAIGNEALSLAAAGGGVLLDPAATLSGGRDGGAAVTITADDRDVTTGAIRASQLTVTGATAIRTGDLAIGGDLALAAANGITTGAITAGAGTIGLDAGSGALATGAIRTSGSVSLKGTGVSFASADAGAFTLNAASGTVRGGDVTSAGAVSIDAGSTVALGRVTTTTGAIGLTSGGTMTLAAVDGGGRATLTSTGTVADIVLTGGLIATDAVTVSATGNIRAPFLRSRTGDLTIRAPQGSIGGIDPGTGTALAAGPGRAFSLTIGAAAQLGDISGGPIEINATSISAGRIDAGATSISLRATDGNLTVLGPVTAGDVTLTATALAQLSAVTASGNVVLGGGTGLSFGDVSGAAITATSAGAVAGGAMRANGAIDLTGGSVRVAGVNADTVTLRAVGGDLTASGTIGGADVTLAASNRLALADVAATRTVTLDGTGGLSFGALSGASVTATSAGAITGSSASASQALSLTGGSISLASATGGSVALRTTAGDLAVTGPVRGSDVTLNAAGRAALSTVDATGAVRVTGAGGVSFGTLAGASITGTSAGALTGTGVRSAGAIDLTGRTVTLATADGRSLAVKATGGDLSVGAITAAGDAALQATGLVRVTGPVTAGGGYRVTGGSVALGGGDTVQSARGEVRITATAGTISGAAGLTLVSDADASAGAEALILDAAGGIDLAGTRLQARPGGGAALGLRVGAGRTVRLGSVEAGAIGGFDGSQLTGTFANDAAFTAGDVTASNIGIALSAGDLAIGRLTAGGAVSLRSAGAVSTGDVQSAGLDLSSGGALTTGTIAARGAATLNGASIAIGDTSAGTLTVRSAGAVSGVGAARPSLSATAGEVLVEAGTARLGAVSATGNATLKADTIDVAGRLTTARALLVQARQALTIGDVAADGDAQLSAGTTLAAGQIDGKAAITAAGAGVAIGAARSGGALTLTSTRDLTLGANSSANGAKISAAGAASLAGLSAGPSLSVDAADAVITGPLRGVLTTFTNTAANTALRLGDGVAADGFRLSAAEIGQITADTARFDAGAGALEIGTLALSPGTGRTVEMLGTGAVRVTGALTSTGARTVRIGGSATNAAANASTIHVVATSDAGGRLLLDGADVELRGTRIAVGLGPGFIDTLGDGDSGRAQATSLVGSANSPLYNPQLGGGFFAPTAPTTLAARSLTVRFGDYALFQNTALFGQPSGIVVGGTPQSPVSPALRLTTGGAPANASFAFFGTVNGVGGASAALLGNSVIDVEPGLLAASRINGCLVGSGAGCLTAIVIQPTLQVFNWSSQDVFGISQDVAVPFAPIVGGNNEALLDDLPELRPARDMQPFAPPPVVPTLPAPATGGRP